MCNKCKKTQCFYWVGKCCPKLNNSNHRYEKHTRQWLRSLTPKARVPGWNPQLNQGGYL